MRDQECCLRHRTRHFGAGCRQKKSKKVTEIREVEDSSLNTLQEQEDFYGDCLLLFESWSTQPGFMLMISGLSWT